MEADCRCGNVRYEIAERLLNAAKEALLGMDGGDDNSPCHLGLVTRAQCAQCRRVDGLAAAIDAAEAE